MRKGSRRACRKRGRCEKFFEQERAKIREIQEDEKENIEASRKDRNEFRQKTIQLCHDLRKTQFSERTNSKPRTDAEVRTAQGTSKQARDVRRQGRE